MIAERCETDRRLKRASPFLECRFDAPAADPEKGPIGRTLGAVRDILAPGIGSNRIGRLPNDVNSPGGIYFA